MSYLGGVNLKKPNVRATVVLLFDAEGKIALARKKQPIHHGVDSIEYSLGLYNGYGGKMDENDVTIEDTAVRELVEETGVRAQKNDLQKKLTALFYIEKDGEINPFMEVVFFTILSFEGVPVESAEMGKPEWFTKDELPYDLMMPADRILFKKIFSNAYKEYVVVLKGKGVAPVVEEVCNCTFIE